MVYIRPSTLNKPLKANVRKYWTEWISSGCPTFTKRYIVRKPNIALIDSGLKMRGIKFLP